MRFSTRLLTACAALVISLAPANAGLFRKKKYENKITKDTLQPDKVLFDRAIGDIEHGRFEVARLTLNTLINTYDSSEYLAKAKLAIADSWYREGGSHGLAQAEAEYKDFILFYPNMEESAESQWRVCEIHYKQMQTADRDSTQGARAEDECRLMITSYPNSRYTDRATQMLRNVQEVLARKEYLAGDFYHAKGAYPAAAARFSFVSKQYPLFSSTDDALWEEADAYQRMGDRFDTQRAEALARIVRDYPLSNHVDDAKQALTEMKQPVPQADPAAYARMKYDLDNPTHRSLMSKAMNIVTQGPDTHLAAKNGAPAMTTVRPDTPVSVAAVAVETEPGAAAGVTDVTAGTVTNSTEIDAKPEARTAATGAPTAEGSGRAPEVAPVSAVTAPPPTNHPVPDKILKQMEKARKKAAKKQAEQKPKTPEATPAAAPTDTPIATTPQK